MARFVRGILTPLGRVTSAAAFIHSPIGATINDAIRALLLQRAPAHKITQSGQSLAVPARQQRSLGFRPGT